MNRLVIITGASRGIGAQIAIDTNQKFSSETIFLLIARNYHGLENVKSKMIKDSDQNEIYLLKIDFSDKKLTSDVLKANLESVLKNKLSLINELFIFYNHGTLKVSPFYDAVSELPREFQINVFSVWALTTAIRDLFPVERVTKQYHINTSSLLANKPSPNTSIYTTTKSAREKLFMCLSLENPSLRVLNYQPGPVYTDMLKDYCDSSNDATFKENYSTGSFLKPEQTVGRLWEIIDKNKFENGSSIDYYDNI